MYHTILRKRIRDKGLLHSAMLELTYRCNLDCFFCYNDKDATGEPWPSRITSSCSKTSPVCRCCS